MKFNESVSPSRDERTRGRDYERVKGIEPSVSPHQFCERRTGIEPATFSLARRHSTDELPPQQP